MTIIYAIGDTVAVRDASSGTAAMPARTAAVREVIGMHTTGVADSADAEDDTMPALVVDEDEDMHALLMQRRLAAYSYTTTNAYDDEGYTEAGEGLTPVDRPARDVWVYWTARGGGVVNIYSRLVSIYGRRYECAGIAN